MCDNIFLMYVGLAHVIQMSMYSKCISSFQGHLTLKFVGKVSI